jgi:alpha-acetolactate decarboxylase
MLKQDDQDYKNKNEDFETREERTNNTRVNRENPERGIKTFEQHNLNKLDEADIIITSIKAYDQNKEIIECQEKEKERYIYAAKLGKEELFLKRKKMNDAVFENEEGVFDTKEVNMTVKTGKNFKKRNLVNRKHSGTYFKTFELDKLD